jgi:acetyltransferase-like isoleucine patch superfamily enzyme
MSFGTRLWRIAGAALNPRFHLFVMRRAKATFARMLRDFEDAKVAGNQAPAGRSDIEVTNYTYLHAHPTATIRPGVRVLTPPQAGSADTGVFLGRETVIGDRVAFEVGPGNTTRVGDFARINPNCRVLGSVQIGRYTLLAPDIFVSSGNHTFGLHPSWLIRDQDALAQAGLVDAPVVIEEDCWIGRGVFIKAGTYIGRGAIIGANSVVTKDVEPYAIHAGVPARCIGSRLEFRPPSALAALNEQDWPYFYAGFEMRQADIKAAASTGALRVEQRFRVILRAGSAKCLRITTLLENGESAALAVLWNRVPVGSIRLDAPKFDGCLSLTTMVPTDRAAMPAPLREFNEFEFVVDRPSDCIEHKLAVAAVALE